MGPSVSSSSSSDSLSDMMGRFRGCSRLFLVSTIDSSSSSSLLSLLSPICASTVCAISSSSPHQRLVCTSSSTSRASSSSVVSLLLLLGRCAASCASVDPTTSIFALLACFLTTLLARLFAYINPPLLPTSVSVVPLRTLRSRCFFSGLARLSSLSFLRRRLLLSTGRSMRCLRGVRASAVVVVFGTKNEFSASDVYRNSRLELFGTSIESPSSAEDVYRSSRVALRGLVRVALVSDGCMKMVGSFGLGLRRRAMIANRNCAADRDTEYRMYEPA